MCIKWLLCVCKYCKPIIIMPDNFGGLAMLHLTAHEDRMHPFSDHPPLRYLKDTLITGACTLLALCPYMCLRLKLTHDY